MSKHRTHKIAASAIMHGMFITWGSKSTAHEVVGITREDIIVKASGYWIDGSGDHSEPDATLELSRTMPFYLVTGFREPPTPPVQFGLPIDFAEIHRLIDEEMEREEDETKALDGITTPCDTCAFASCGLETGQCVDCIDFDHYEDARSDGGAETSDNPLDVQIDGTHYKDQGIQPVEYIAANELNFFEGNIVKYVTRHRLKGGAKDLRKVIHYAEMMLKLEYAE